MDYLMMRVAQVPADKKTVQGLCELFNLSANDFDQNFDVIPDGEHNLIVMVTEEAAKKMLVQHVENTVAGKGPFVEGPFGNGPMEYFKP